MATYDPAAIRSAIKTLVSGVTSVSKVYDFLNPEIEGYPAVIFDVSDEEASMLDDANNLRIITFKMWLVVEIPVKLQVGARDLLDTITKDVINVLELKANDTLSGTVDWVVPVVGPRTQSLSPEGNFFYQELNIQCNVASTIL